MPAKRKTSISALVLILGLGFALPSAANQVVGSQGTVLRALNGTFGSIFPGSTDHPAESSVLALEVVRDGVAQRLLVPGTESYSEEYSPTLVHDSRAEVTYLLWEGLHNGVHPLLYLRSYDGSQWGPEIELSGSPFARKGHPQLFVTRDRSLEPTTEATGPVEVERAVLHVFWWEEIGDQLRKRYSPVVLEAGRFIGANPVRDLSELIAAGPDAVFQPNFGETLKVQAGPDMGSAIAGFLEQDLGQLVTVKVEVAPRALSRLAESVIDFVSAQPAGLTPADLAARVRDHVATAGTGLHPATLDYLKLSVYAMIAGLDPAALTGGLQNVAGQAGIHILVIGRRHTVELGNEIPLGVVTAARADGARPWHHVSLAHVASFSLPAEVGVDTRYFFSKSGKDACVAWRVENKVYYRETASGGQWTEPRSIDVTDSLSLDTVLAIIEQRTLDR
jgi:hypothetical protein